jgi:hypothetical protein
MSIFKTQQKNTTLLSSESCSESPRFVPTSLDKGVPSILSGLTINNPTHNSAGVENHSLQHEVAKSDHHNENYIRISTKRNRRAL